MRLAAAIAVIAVAFSAAVYIHQRHTWTTTTSTLIQSKPGDNPSVGIDIGRRVRHHPSWEDPLAVILAISGIAAAVGLVAYRTPVSPNPPS
jgi:hypothetical protein